MLLSKPPWAPNFLCLLLAASDTLSLCAPPPDGAKRGQWAVCISEQLPVAECGSSWAGWPAIPFPGRSTEPTVLQQRERQREKERAHTPKDADVNAAAAARTREATRAPASYRCRHPHRACRYRPYRCSSTRGTVSKERCLPQAARHLQALIPHIATCPHDRHAGDTRGAGGGVGWRRGGWSTGRCALVVRVVIEDAAAWSPGG
jgi:hypothetical protein